MSYTFKEILITIVPLILRLVNLFGPVLFVIYCYLKKITNPLKLRLFLFVLVFRRSERVLLVLEILFYEHSSFSLIHFKWEPEFVFAIMVDSRAERVKMIFIYDKESEKCDRNISHVYIRQLTTTIQEAGTVSNEKRGQLKLLILLYRQTRQLQQPDNPGSCSGYIRTIMQIKNLKTMMTPTGEFNFV